MSKTAFSELPPHWQRHHFAEVPTTMELLREDALEERADIEEERKTARVQKENMPSTRKTSKQKRTEKTRRTRTPRTKK